MHTDQTTDQTTDRAGWKGKRVRVADRATWSGDRHGIVTGDAYADTLPTGAVFVPVTFDDGATANVDSRVLVITGVASAATLTHDVMVVATLTYTDGSGWTSARQVPTFTVPASVHALPDLPHAARVAADVLLTYAPNGTRAVLALSTPDATHVATFETVSGQPVRVA